MKAYQLEIYAQDEDPFITIESDQPFPAIAVGDLLNPGVWDSTTWPGVKDFTGKSVLKVATIEHLIFQSGKGPVKFKICLFCDPISDTRVARRRPKSG